MAALLYTVLILLTALVPPSACQLPRCPSSCSSLSPIPYPFGGADGCGAPGFLLSNCSAPRPQWDLHLGDTMHVYYIQRIFSTPGSSNHNSSVLSYGYGGAVLLSLPTSNTALCSDSDPLSHLIDAFSSSNMYAFQGASLRFYQQHYLLFNCSSDASIEPPQSGVFMRSSKHCTNYLARCGLSRVDRCFEYSPDQELYLPALMSSYHCSSFRRFVITGDNEPVDDWVDGTQFAWGPVEYADVCSTCQNTGGTCGYDVKDSSFRCYCGNDTFDANCNGQKDAGSRRVVIISVVVSVAVVLVSATIAFYFLWQRSYQSRVFGDGKQLRLEGINQAPITFPFRALTAATSSFKTEIGQGAFGKVYKGVLSNGIEVAVKVLDTSLSYADEQFMNEVATVGNIHHVNVARLFGFCFSKSRRILVYEYVCNGSLDRYLFPDKSSSSHLALLSWKQRFEIAMGIARGLSYMHKECHKHIIHCDIKPQNILLDALYCPKISDFGLARLLAKDVSRVVTQARGTPGYVAPEFWSLGKGPLTSKFDVYSYGMVLLEIVRGQRCAHMLDPFSLQECIADEISTWSTLHVDKRIAHNADLEQAQLCTLVALWCIQEDPAERPTMDKVVQYLQGTIPVPSNPPSPFRRLELYYRASSSKVLEDSSTGPSSKISQNFPNAPSPRD